MEKVLVKTIPYFSDNYCYLIHHPLSGRTALVDCGEAESVLRHLTRIKWNLDAILLTHYHFDHTGGTSKVVKAFPQATLYTPVGEDRIGLPSVDPVKRLPSNRVEVKDGDKIRFGPLEIEVFSVPAHTKYCTSFYLQGHLFVSDALFSAGCGRLFEGTAGDLERAMDRFASFPPETLIYFGHEYTLANLKFALTVEPDNHDILDYINHCQKLRQEGQFTTPTAVAQELKINPFLRIDQEEVIQFVDPDRMYSRTERIGLLRKTKDQF